MSFYGIEYLKSHAAVNGYLKYGLIFGSLIVLVIVFVLYLKYRYQTKYRDLGIIFFLLLIFSLGVQYSDYQINQTKNSQSSQMVGFVKNLADEKNINAENIFVNGTQLSDGIIVKIKANYFRVNLDSNQQVYSLTKVAPLSDEIKVIKK